MTTETGARIYRRAPKPLPDGACPHCTRMVSITRLGRRRAHRDLEGRDCPGGGIFVGDPAPVWLDDMPDVKIPPRVPGGETCPGCGQRPRIKDDGAFASHRIDVDNPASPRCPNGAERSRV